jgi:hypothetical protein
MMTESYVSLSPFKKSKSLIGMPRLQGLRLADAGLAPHPTP